MQLMNAMWLFALALPFGDALVAAYSAHGRHGRSHQTLAKRADSSMQLWKRYSDSRWTFFDVGLGACGKTNVPTDFIVALNSAQYGGGSPGPQCFKFITMTYNGKTTQAQIMDECPGCPYGGLDLSIGLFTFFAAESVGVVYGTWSFASGGDSGSGSEPSSTSKKPPKTTYSPPPKPTPTSTPDHDTTTTSSTTTASSSYASSSTLIDISVGVSGLAAPAATGVVNTMDGSNLNNINAALVGLGELLVAGAQLD